jgi:hypothetical protein
VIRTLDPTLETSERVVVFQNITVLAVRESERTVEIILPLPCLHHAFGLEPIEVGQIAQSGEAKCLQECLRRHIGEWGAG